MGYPAAPLHRVPMLAAALLASLAVPAAAEHDRDGVTLFEDVHFRGRYETFHGDVSNLRRTYLGNDCASSIEVPRGCQVTLFRDASFRGASVTLDHGVTDLRYSRVGNDEVSSLSVSCYDGRRGGWGRDRGDVREDRRTHDRRDDGWRDDRRFRGVTLFSDAGFRGRSESFAHNDADLRDNRIRQDSVSSIDVAPGCRAILYSDAGFRGRATQVTGSAADLRNTAVGNDRVSSIQVDCRGR